MIEYGFGIGAVDAGYRRPGMAAIYVIVERGRALIVDTGVNASLPLVLDALNEKSVAVDAVDYVVLTHIHLDHAGGAGALMAALPQARLAVHPRGARHMADPTQLVAGATAVYGSDAMHSLYGDIIAVPVERMLEMPHESTLVWQRREFAFFDTPGHARHHLCMFDTRSGHVFTGDTFGLSYRELDRDGRQFVFPTTTPVQFEPEALHRSIELIVGLRPRAAYPTHFGRIQDVPRLADDLHRLLDSHVQLARGIRETGGVRHEQLKQGLSEIVLDEARRCRWPATADAILGIFAEDIELNAQGLGAWLDARAGQRLPTAMLPS